MGNCTQATAKLKPDAKPDKLGSKKANEKTKRTLSLKDTKGFKHWDDIHEFY